MSGLVPSTLHPLLPYWVSPHIGLLIQGIRYLRNIGGKCLFKFVQMATNYSYLCRAFHVDRSLGDFIWSQSWRHQWRLTRLFGGKLVDHSLTSAEEYFNYVAQFFPRVNCWADIQELFKSKSWILIWSRRFSSSLNLYLARSVRKLNWLQM